MCPDKALLSSYVDGEVPSPWKERLEDHIAQCSSCSAAVERMDALRAMLNAPVSTADELALKSARERIAETLTSGQPARSGRSAALFDKVHAVLTRRIALPVPFLAAGILALVFFAGMTLGVITPFTNAAKIMASASKTFAPTSGSYEVMAEYLKQSASYPVMIEMPAESVFSQFGNPVLISYGEPSITEIQTTSYGSGSQR